MRFKEKMSMCACDEANRVDGVGRKVFGLCINGRMIDMVMVNVIIIDISITIAIISILREGQANGGMQITEIRTVTSEIKCNIGLSSTQYFFFCLPYSTTSALPTLLCIYIAFKCVRFPASSPTPQARSGPWLTASSSCHHYGRDPWRVTGCYTLPFR